MYGSGVVSAAVCVVEVAVARIVDLLHRKGLTTWVDTQIEAGSVGASTLCISGMHKACSITIHCTHLQHIPCIYTAHTTLAAQSTLSTWLHPWLQPWVCGRCGGSRLRRE